jgi:hypothetical protein
MRSATAKWGRARGLIDRQGRDNTCPFSGLCASYDWTDRVVNSGVSQSKVKAMNELSTWMQSNWYALGNLFIEGAVLAVVVWFARKILRTLRASQEQVGALLKMSVTGAIAERTSSPAASERSFANASPYWLTPSSEVPAAPLQGLHESRPGLGHRTIVWLKTPMKRSEVAPWRRAIKWLQAPVRS